MREPVNAKPVEIDPNISDTRDRMSAERMAEAIQEQEDDLRFERFARRIGVAEEWVPRLRMLALHPSLLPEDPDQTGDLV